MKSILLLLVFSLSIAEQPHYIRDGFYRDSEYLNRVIPGFMGYLVPHKDDAGGYLLPRNSTRITALVAHPDAQAYGFTSGEPGYSPYFFYFKTKRLFATGALCLNDVLPGQECINTNAMRVLPDGNIICGSSNYRDSTIGRWTPNGWIPYIKMVDPSYEGGHLFLINPEQMSRNGKLNIVDLGIVLKNKGIRCIIPSKDGKRIFGLLDPTYEFFDFDLKSRKSRIIPIKMWEQREDNNILRKGRDLVLDSAGNCYGTVFMGQIFKYEPLDEHLYLTDSYLPSIPGHHWLCAVDCFLSSDDGSIYGGTESDGILFRFDPPSGEVESFGKILDRPRIRGLAWGNDGKIYGTAGDDNSVSRFFTFDPVKRVFFNFGGLEVPILRDGASKWKLYQLGPIVSIPKFGMLIIGEEDILGHLVSYQPPIPAKK
ncbi:MAG: WD40 repeat domain-containing protein [bacterium]